MSTTPIKTVSLQHAQIAIKNYRKYMHAHGIDNIVNGFLIIHADIVQALETQNEMPPSSYHHFRGYIGLTDDTNPPATSDPLYSPWRFFVVPVDIKGDDVIPFVEGIPVVYDFDAPCPTTCDPNSPLFNV